MLVVLAACLLAGCGVMIEQTPGHLIVRAARITPAVDGDVLVLDLDCRLSGPMRDALDHGIPITLRIHVEGEAGANPVSSTGRADATESIELRYFPLSQRYQLREVDGEAVRNFTAPAALIDALAGLRLTLPESFGRLPAGSRYSVGVTVDRSALPGALRLPATLEPAWWLAATAFRWTA